ncbi:MAG TPA: hypothetical protein VMY05_05210 [Acidobacteriota bacterium]|nr:hypothetical protein [Acidobacteriota bacterium]
MVENNQGSTDLKRKRRRVWLIYLSAIVAAAILLADAFAYPPMQKITARIGLALLFSAIALVAGNGRAPGYIAAIILWGAVILTFFI